MFWLTSGSIGPRSIIAIILMMLAACGRTSDSTAAVSPSPILTSPAPVVTSQPTPAYGTPPARTDHGMVYDVDLGVVVMYGGRTHGQAVSPKTWLADTWLWDGRGWSQFTSSSGPTARGQFGMTYDAVNRKVLLFGGLTTKTYPNGGFEDVFLNDTWAWDRSGWVQLNPSTKPPALNGMTVSPSPDGNGSTYVHGLSTSEPTFVTWQWDGQDWKNVASALAVATTHPGLSATAVYDPSLSATLAVGSCIRGSEPKYYTFDGKSWTGHADQTNAQVYQRCGPALAYDAYHSVAVMFGGAPGQGDTLMNGPVPTRFSDTWTFDGKTWSPRSQGTSTSSPRGRYATAMVYDPAIQRIVLFGGNIGVGSGDGSSDVAGDTWTYDGVSWSKVG